MSLNVRWLGALLLIFNLTGHLHASAKTDTPSLNGTWVGNIGSSQVVACFTSSNYSGNVSQGGVYFYLRYAKLIALEAGDANGDLWNEWDAKNHTGSWSVRVKHDILTGTWSNSDQTKKLPITLVRARSITSYRSSTCNSEVGIFVPDVYKQAHSVKVASGDIKSIDGKRYRQLSALDGAIKSVELVDSISSTAALNAMLINELRDGVSSYYTCHNRGEGDGKDSWKEVKHDYTSELELTFWRANWISFSTVEAGDCGGAHPFIEYTPVTLDLVTLKEINPWHWISDSRKEDAFSDNGDYYDNYQAPEALNKLIAQKALKQRIAQFPAEAKNGCMAVIEDNHEYQIRLGDKGMIFTPHFGHSMEACDSDVEIPYGKLFPFLTKDGRVAVKKIMKANP